MTARLSSFVSPFFSLFIATLVLVAGADSGSAAGRVALVIGNSAYQALPVLPNPANDATDVAAELGEMGYDVTVRTNATRVEMANVIAQFAEKMRDELALLFYAGHGVQLNGENYLLPVDATGESEAALRLSTIDLSSLQDAMADARANVIILDACRNNPFANAIAAHRGIGVSRELTPMDTRGRRVADRIFDQAQQRGGRRRRPQLAVHGRADQSHERKRPRDPSDDLARPQGRSRRDWRPAGPLGQFLARRRRLSGGGAVDGAFCPAHAGPSDPGRPSDGASGSLRGRFYRRFGCAGPQPVHGIVAA